MAARDEAEEMQALAEFDRLAAAAGIDHWAFVVYPDATDLAAALHAYLKSSTPARARPCIQAQLSR